MPAIYLTEDDVRDLIDMETSIEVVEEAFRQLAADNAKNVPRSRAAGKGILLHTMSAAAEYLGLVGWKAYTTTRDGARFHVAAYDSSSGEMLALISANYLGQLRTGAASGVATRYMARKDSKTVGVFGAGLQARTQLEAVCCVRPIERAEVYCRDEDRRKSFANEMSEYCQTEVVAVADPHAVAAAKDVVITASTSKKSVFDGSVLAAGTHLNVIGSNFLAKTEIDVETIRRSDIIVCDSIEQCRLEAGDFVAAMDNGILTWDQVGELADVVTASKPGRESEDQITLFKSVGMGIEDVAMAAKILEHARRDGRGVSLPF